MSSNCSQYKMIRTWTTLYRLVFETDLAIKYSNTHMVNVSILIVKIKTGKQLNFTIITG